MNTWLDMIVKLYENKLKLGSDIMKGSKRQKVSSYLDVLEIARQEIPYESYTRLRKETCWLKSMTVQVSALG